MQTAGGTDARENTRMKYQSSNRICIALSASSALRIRDINRGRDGCTRKHTDEIPEQ